MSQFQRATLLATLLFGLVSGVLYLALYHYAQPILEYSRQGRWYFIVPIVIAFVFSYVHGQFTGQFWDLLGMRAKSSQAQTEE